MSSDDLDQLIHRLADIVPSETGFLGFGVRRQDWKPFFGLAKEIQEAFNSGVRYSSKQLRQPRGRSLTASELKDFDAAIQKVVI
jgi:hypothetical protein